MRESYVIVNGVRTRYLEAGHGSPLVLVHGGSFGMEYSANDWDTNIDALGESFHVYAFDKIGCGFTDNPRKDDEYVIGTMVSHAHGFMDAMRIEAATVAGHSRGGYVATRVALERPDRVKALVIVDSSTLMTPPNPIYDRWRAEAEKIPDIRERVRYLAKVNSHSEEHLTDAYLDVTAKVLGLPKTREAAAKMRAGKQRFKEDLVARQEETHGWIRAGRLKCPTLVVWGFNDPSATMERCGIPCMNLILPSVPESEMHVINRAGHPCFREHPDTFNAVVLDFLQRHSLRNAG